LLARGSMMITLPRRLVEEARRRGLDVEREVLTHLIKALSLDPVVEAEVHEALASRYFEEGKGLVEKDPVQACEKLYKAAEERVKELAMRFDLKEVLSRVEEKGRWTAAELERAVLLISRRVGGWFRDSWDAAWALHVWGFHEAKLGREDVEERLPAIEKMVRFRP